jgi:hypothetical protein
VTSLDTGRPSVTTARASGGGGVVTAAWPLPGVGTTTQTCAGGGTGLPRTGSDGCSRWLGSGPINIVILSTTPESPYGDAVRETSPRWTPAQGGWLAARVPTRGCGSDWTTSEGQIELRMTKVTRRHLKFMQPGCRYDGYWVTVGEAHTDLFERRRCGGDHIADLDVAREALVASLVAGGGVARVEYHRWRPAGTTFPDGCGGRVATDGRVAYIWLKG